MSALLLGPLAHLPADKFADIIAGNLIPERDSATDLLELDHLIVYKVHEFLLRNLFKKICEIIVLIASQNQTFALGFLMTTAEISS